MRNRRKYTPFFGPRLTTVGVVLDTGSGVGTTVKMNMRWWRSTPPSTNYFLHLNINYGVLSISLAANGASNCAQLSVMVGWADGRVLYDGVCVSCMADVNVKQNAAKDMG